MSLPTAKLRLECAMVNPPKPTGFVITNDAGEMLAVATLDEVRRAYEQWREAQALYDDARR